MDVRLMGMRLVGVPLMGAYLMGMYLMACTSGVITQSPVYSSESLGPDLRNGIW